MSKWSSRKQAFKRVALILSPESGGHDNMQRVSAIVSTLHQHGVQPQVFVTTPQEAHELARQAVRRGATLIIAGGGDGTIEAVARALIHTATTLGLLRMGTYNNVCDSLHIPDDLDQAVETIVDGETQGIDVGQVGDFYFLEEVGVGLEAALFPIGDRLKDGGLAALPAVWCGLRILKGFRVPTLAISLDGQHPMRLRALQISVSNTPHYGMNFWVAPEAALNDGWLDVVYLDTPSKWADLRYFRAITRGPQAAEGRLRVYQAGRIEITSDTPLPVHADDVPLGHTPVTIKAVPGALRVRVPTATQLERFARASAAPGRAQPALPSVISRARPTRQAIVVSLAAAVVLSFGVAQLWRHRVG